MKKFVKSILSIALFLWCTLSLNAQINFEGSNEYGRINDIIYDLTTEGTIYGLTLGNHIVESQNEGQDWEVIYSFPENGTSIRDLRQLGGTTLSFYVQSSSSSANNTIFLLDIATNEIIKQYTPPVSDGAEKEWVNTYSIYESDTDVVLFDQSYKIGNDNYSKVYYTVNGGNSWTEVYYNVDHDSVFPNNVAISPNNPQKLFIARGNGPTSVDGGLFISENAGTTWIEKLPGQNLKEITFKPLNPDTILIGTTSGGSTLEKIYKSEDGGNLWNAFPISWDSFSIKYIEYIGYDPNNLDNIIILESNEIALSSDGGISWTNYIYPDQPGSYFFGLHASYNPFQAGEIIISTDYFPVKSTDGGVTVSQLENPFFNSKKVGVSTEGDQHLYYEVQRGLVHKNLTTQIVTPYFVAPINIFSSNSPPVYFLAPKVEGRVYAFFDQFDDQQLVVSDSHGGNSTFLYGTSFDFIGLVKTDPNNFNKIWVSFEYDGTKRIDFTDLSSPIVTAITMPNTDLHFSTFIEPSDSNSVLVGMEGEIFRTLDNGSTWINVSDGLTLTPGSDAIFDIKQNPYDSAQYIIATSQGLFESVDGAESWSQIYNGSIVHKLEYSTVVEGQIAASITSSQTTQAQVIYSIDNGAEWVEVPFESIENVGSHSMDFMFHEESLTAYIATFSLGVITYEIDTTTLSNSNSNIKENTLIIYPNPTDSFLNVVLKNGTTASTITVYTYTGKKVLEVSQQNKIDISNLNKGVYIARIADSEGALFIKKIIKK